LVEKLEFLLSELPLQVLPIPIMNESFLGMDVQKNLNHALVRLQYALVLAFLTPPFCTYECTSKVKRRDLKLMIFYPKNKKMGIEASTKCGSNN
jgi:hypothetical protein